MYQEGFLILAQFQLFREMELQSLFQFDQLVLNQTEQDQHKMNSIHTTVHLQGLVAKRRKNSSIMKNEHQMQLFSIQQ